MRSATPAVLILLCAIACSEAEPEPVWTELRRLPLAFEIPEGVRVWTLAATDTVLIVECGGALIGLDAETGRRLWSEPVAPLVIAPGPEGEWFACGFDEEANPFERRIRLELRDAVTGRLRTTVGSYETSSIFSGQQIGLANTRALSGVAVHPSGKRLTVSAMTSLCTWTLGPERWTRGRIGERGASDLAFGPEGRTVVTGRFRSRKLVWWDLDGNRIRSVKSAPAVSLDAAGGIIAFTTTPGTVHLADHATGKEIRRLRPRVGPTNDIVFSPDGAYVFAIGNLRVLRAWEVATGEVVGAIPLDFRTYALAVAENRLYVAGEKLAAFAWR